MRTQQSAVPADLETTAEAEAESAHPLAEFEQPSPLSPAHERLDAAKRNRDATHTEQNAIAAEQDAAEKVIAAGISIGPEIAQRIEAWAMGETDTGPDLPNGKELERLRQDYAKALAAQAELPHIRARLNRAHEEHLMAIEAAKHAAAEVILEEANSALAELQDAERRALAMRAKVNGAYRFLERAATTKRMGLPGSPITMLAEGLRRRIPPQNEISLTAVQGEVASWDSLFDHMTRYAKAPAPPNG
jgi:hypothetical protein